MSKPKRECTTEFKQKTSKDIGALKKALEGQSETDSNELKNHVNIDERAT